MSKNIDKQAVNYSNYQRAFAAILYNANYKFLTLSVTLIPKSTHSYWWCPPNILGALYAIALGHPAFVHNIPLKDDAYVLKQGLTSPMNCLEYMLLNTNNREKFENALKIHISANPAPNISKLVNDIKELKNIYVNPDKKEDFEPIHVINMRDVASLLPQTQTPLVLRIFSLFRPHRNTAPIPEPTFHINISETELRKQFPTQKNIHETWITKLNAFFPPVLSKIIAEYGEPRIPDIQIKPPINFQA
jgi:hypothetical protein